MAERSVARSTRAWIETFPELPRQLSPPSHALRVRGLKLPISRGDLWNVPSHALRVRGLKPVAGFKTKKTLCRTLYACVD